MKLRRRAREETLLEVVGQRLAARYDPPQAGAQRDARLSEKDLQHRGYEVERRDLTFKHEVDEVRTVLMPLGARDDERGPGQQRPEELPHRDVEAEGRLLHDSVVGRQAVSLLHPEQAITDGAVRVHRALRPPRRARGVDDVCEIVGRRQRREVFIAEPIECRRVVNADHLPASGRETVEQSALRQQHGAGGVFEHEREALGRVRRVERHVSAARLEHAEQRDDQLRRALQHDADPRVRADAERAQASGQTVGARVQLGVCQPLALEDDGRGPRRARGLLLAELVQALFRRVHARRVVPLDEQLPALARGQERQVGDASVGGSHDAFEQGAVMREHEPDARRVEEVGAVAYRETQPVGRLVCRQTQI
jgi:hypothetical protein